MKEYLLIILMVLASVICSVLCRQLIRSNEQIRRQIAEMEGKIEEAKTPKVIVRKSQAIQHQSVATTSAGHAANAELRQEKRVLEKQVAEVRKDIGTSDLASGRLGKRSVGSRRRNWRSSIRRRSPSMSILKIAKRWNACNVKKLNSARISLRP